MGSKIASNADTTDNQYYMVTIPAGKQDGVLKLTLTQANAQWQPQIITYSGTKSQLDQQNASSGVNPFIAQEPVTAGSTYYFQIPAANGQNTDYTCNVAFTPIPDPGERNDTIQTATPVTLGTAATFYIFAGFDTTGGNDVDYFTFTVPAGDSHLNLNIVDNSPNTASGLISGPQQLAYTLYDSTMTNVVSQASAANSQANISTTSAPIALTQAGVYYLKINDGDSHNSINADQLTVTALP